MNTQLARKNMIKGQIQPWGVLDRRIMELFFRLPREDFIPKPFESLAFADVAIPIGHGQFTMVPALEARLLQDLQISSTDRILEIGTGCAYLTALLAQLAASVTSVDIYNDFATQAASRLAAHAIENVVLQTGNVFSGWHTDDTFDVIVVTGSVSRWHHALLSKLAAQGRMFVIIGKPPIMEACLLHCIDGSTYMTESLFETELPPLLYEPVATRFEF